MLEYYTHNVLGCSSKQCIFKAAVLHVLCSFLIQFLEVTQFNFRSLWNLAVGDSETIPQRYYRFFKGSFATGTCFLGYQHHKHMCHFKHFLPAILRQHFWNLSRVYLLLKERSYKGRQHLSEFQMVGCLGLRFQAQNKSSPDNDGKAKGHLDHTDMNVAMPRLHIHSQSHRSPDDMQIHGAEWHWIEFSRGS